MVRALPSTEMRPNVYFTADRRCILPPGMDARQSSAYLDTHSGRRTVAHILRRMRAAWIAVAAAIVLVGLGLIATPRAQTPSYDLVIRNGRIVDGTGSPWYRADVAVRGDTIARIAPRIDAPAARGPSTRRGRSSSPGFIDLHTHARRGIFQVPTAENYVRQGVTTIMEGPDGSSPLPIKPFLDRVAATRVTPNFGAVRRPGHHSRPGDRAGQPQGDRRQRSRRCAAWCGRAWRTARSA